MDYLFRIEEHTAWKVCKYGQSICGKMRTRTTPNTDTFHAVQYGGFYMLAQLFLITLGKKILLPSLIDTSSLTSCHVSVSGLLFVVVSGISFTAARGGALAVTVPFTFSTGPLTASSRNFTCTSALKKNVLFQSSKN